MASPSSKGTQNREGQQAAAQPDTGGTSRETKNLLGITLAACLILFIFAFSSSLWGPNIGPLSHLLHTPSTTVQFFLELWAVGYIPGALAGGLLLDRFGPRTTFLMATLILSGGLLAFLACLSFPHLAPMAMLLVLVGIAGLGGGIIDASANGMMSSVYAHKRGTVLNLFSLIYPIAGFIIALVEAGLLTVFHNDPRPAFIFPIAFALVALLSLPGIPEHFRIKHGTNNLKSTIKSAPTLLRILAPVIIVMVLTGGVYISIYTWDASYMHTAFKQPASLIAILIGVTWIVDALGRLGAAGLITRLGSWKITLLSIGTGLLGLLVLIFSRDVFVATAGFAIAITGLGPIYGTSLTLAGERTERTLGSVTGILLFANALFGLFWIWLFGLLLHSTGTFWPVLSSIILVLLSGLVALSLRPEHHR